MSSISIINRGKRTISVAGGKLKPDEMGVFSEETAKKLIRLFPKELVTQDSIKATFVEAKAAVTEAAKASPSPVVAEKKKTPAQKKLEKAAAKASPSDDDAALGAELAGGKDDEE